MAKKSWFEKLLSSDNERAKRQQTEGFAAYYWTGSAVKEVDVRDISSTGVYLLTDESWPLEKLVTLTLQRKGPMEMDPGRRMTWQARVARRGADGLGLSFISPTDAESRLWESLLGTMVERTQVEDTLRLVRMADILGFLRRLCPTGAEEVKQLFSRRLSNYRIANAVEIVLKAENRLRADPNADRLLAPTNLVVRILEDGSNADEAWLQEDWAGLLAGSCTPDGRDESNMATIDLFKQLLPVQVRILSLACTRATKTLSDSGMVVAKPLTCVLSEVLETTGAKEKRVQQELERMAEIGVLESRDDLPFSVAVGDVVLTPSSLGLELCARYSGHRGKPREFYQLSIS